MALLMWKEIMDNYWNESWQMAVKAGSKNKRACSNNKILP
jgi:hypothetical protein